MRTPCIGCPFRTGSKMAYDGDAIDALERGYVASCHEVVGVDSIFGIDNPGPDKVCIGQMRYEAGDHGYSYPATVEAKS